MRKLLVVLLVLVVVGVGVAFAMGWFSITNTPNPDTGKKELKFQVNQDKFKADMQKAKDKLGGSARADEEKPAGK